MIYVADGVTCCTASAEHDGVGNKWRRPSRDARSSAISQAVQGRLQKLGGFKSARSQSSYAETR